MVIELGVIAIHTDSQAEFKPSLFEIKGLPVSTVYQEPKWYSQIAKHVLFL